MKDVASLRSPHPWDFDNSQAQLVSSDGKNRILYGELMEVGMGAPLSASCFWVDSDGVEHHIDDWCGGPPIWNSEGTKAAIPAWARSWMRTVQQIIVLDIEKKEALRYAPEFRVLDLRSFDGHHIYGYDSPVYKTQTLDFDLSKEKVIAAKDL